MTITTIMQRALLALLIASLAAPAWAQGVSPPAAKPGDRWVYGGPNGKRSLHVDSVAGDGTIDATVDAPGLSGLAMRYTKDWNLLLAPVPMLGTIHYQRYSPPLCVMPPSPWSTGQTWSCDAGWSDGTYSGTIHLAGKIDGMEKVTVPAGTFDTVHARLNVSGTEVNCWFAPQAGNWVQCKSPLPDFNYALASYALK
jgi:hypothetical protein